MKVEQIMSRPALTCHAHDPANRAAQVMWESDIGCVVVVEHDKIVGIVTDRDLCMAAYTRGVTLAQISVGDVMTRNVTTIGPDASISEAISRLVKGKIGCLPVVEDGKLAGLITETDLLRCFSDLLQAGRLTEPLT